MPDSNPITPQLEALLKRVARVAEYLWQKGWAERNAGNLSIDVTQILHEPGSDSTRKNRPLPCNYPNIAGRSFLVTGSGHKFRDLARDISGNACILRVNGTSDGFSLIWGAQDAPRFRPTSELPSHLRIHDILRAENSPNNLVLHSHPTELIALSHLSDFQDEQSLNDALFSIHPEVKFIFPEGVGLVPYVTPGSEDLALATAKVFKQGRTIALWQMHGVVAVGSDVEDAFDLLDTINKAAKLILLCRSTGEKPKGLTREQVEQFAAAFTKKDC